MVHKNFLLFHYNVSKDWAQQYYDSNRDEINSFDIVVTSDTAPLSRIFLQNVSDLEPRLVVWICNRFDYMIWGDVEFYSLVQTALKRKDSKVLFIPYTEYEKGDSRVRLSINIDKTSTITPHGLQLSTKVIEDKAAEIYGLNSNSEEKNLNQTIFVTRYANDQSYVNTPAILKRRDVPHISGSYTHPKQLASYAAVVTFPDAMSKFLTFETIQYGIPVVLPSISWLRKLAAGNYFLNGDNQGGKPIAEYWFQNEWYRFPECRIYVDNEDDLAQVALELSRGTYPGLEQLRTEMAARGEQLRRSVIAKWGIVFSVKSSYSNADVYNQILQVDKENTQACVSTFESVLNDDKLKGIYEKVEYVETVQNPRKIYFQDHDASVYSVFEFLIESTMHPKVIIHMGDGSSSRNEDVLRIRNASPKTANVTALDSDSRLGSFLHIASKCNQHIDGLRIMDIDISDPPLPQGNISWDQKDSFVSSYRISPAGLVQNYDGPPATIFYLDHGNSRCKQTFLEETRLLIENRDKMFGEEAYIVVDAVSLSACKDQVINGQLENIFMSWKPKISALKSLSATFAEEGWEIVHHGDLYIFRAPPKGGLAA